VPEASGVRAPQTVTGGLLRQSPFAQRTTVERQGGRVRILLLAPALSGGTLCPGLAGVLPRRRLTLPADLTLEAALELSSCRRRWFEAIDRLLQSLRPPQSLIRVWDPAWEHARSHCRHLWDYQFVEEGSSPFPRLGTELHLYTDGSFVSADGKTATGAAFLPLHSLGQGDVVLVPLPSDDDQSHNRAEVHAVLAAIRYARTMGASCVVVHTDSMFVWNWFHNMRREYRLIRYAALEHSDLLALVDAEMRCLQEVYCVKVRSHNGHRWKDEVDRGAHLAAGTSSFWRYGLSGPRWCPPAPPPDAELRLRRRALPYVCSDCARRFRTHRGMTCHHTRVHGVTHGPIECRHRCRDKVQCAHACCKRHL